MQKRIVEAYIGEYASGKSENAVGRARERAAQGRTVTLVDLDLVEPCYTLRSIQEQLTADGVDVLAWHTSETRGLGESGQVLLPAARWSLRRPGDIIFDIGYGVSGLQILNLVEGAADDPDLQVLLIANFCRPIVGSVDLLVDYARSLGRIDALIANTHLDQETTPQLVREGYAKTVQAAEQLGVPVAAAAVDELFARENPDFGLPVQVRVLKRYLPAGFW